MSDIRGAVAHRRHFAVIAMRYLLVGTTLIASVANAQVGGETADTAANDTGRVDEIIVTATRREESSQKVPIALTAIGSRQLDKLGVTTALQLPQLAPSMYVVGALSVGSPRYTIRGIANSDTMASAGSAVATYVDDVYQASQYGLSVGLFDLQRVEVLRGPQGTTFGKNTTGGAVVYFSQAPTNEFSGNVTGRLADGDQSEKFLRGAVNIPLVDQTLAMRASFSIDRRGNFFENPTNPTTEGNGKSHAGRLQLQWKPSIDTTINLLGYYTKAQYDAAIGRGVYGPGNAFGLPPNDLNIDVVPLTPYTNLVDDFVNKGVTLRIQQALGDFDLTSITHYRKTSFDKGNDSDGRPEDIFGFFSQSLASQYGQEIRLASDSTQALSGLVGLYYQKEKLRDVTGGGTTISTGPFAGPFGEYNNHSLQRTTTTSYAIFANLKYAFSDQLSLSGGIRKTIEKRRQNARLDYFYDRNYDWTGTTLAYEGPPPITPTQTLIYTLGIKTKPWTWDVTLDYKPSDAVLLFGRVARGFRSGGFNPAGIGFFATPAQTVPAPFGNETLQSYEVGLKSTLLDRRLRFNAGVYHYDFNNQQVIVPGPGGIPSTQNAGKSKVDGGEIEIIATPIDRLDLSVNASYTDAKYKVYQAAAGDYAGNRLIQAPKWTLNGSAAWSAPVTSTHDLALSSFWSYRSAIFFTPDNSLVFKAGQVAIGNFRAGIQPSAGTGFSVHAFVNNMTNRKPLAFGASFGPETNIKYFQTGRLYGVDIGFRW